MKDTLITLIWSFYNVYMYQNIMSYLHVSTMSVSMKHVLIKKATESCIWD